MPIQPRRPTSLDAKHSSDDGDERRRAGEHERNGSGATPCETFNEAELVDAVANDANSDEREDVASRGRFCVRISPMASSTTTAMTMRTALYASGGTVRVPYLATV